MTELQKIDIDEKAKIEDNLNPPNTIIENLDDSPVNINNKQNNNNLNFDHLKRDLEQRYSLLHPLAQRLQVFFLETFRFILRT